MKIFLSEEDLIYLEEAIVNGEVLREDLKRWFKEKWVDVSKKVKGKHPPCGRKKASDKGYPKCRPSKKVSSETPKTAGSFDAKEKKAMTAQKRKAEKDHSKVGTGNSPKMTHYNEGHQVIKLTMEQVVNEKLINVPPRLTGLLKDELADVAGLVIIGVNLLATVVVDGFNIFIIVDVVCDTFDVP